MLFVMATILLLWRILKALMANIASPYGEYQSSHGGYRISYGDNPASYGEYPLVVWRKLFCYGGNCPGGCEGMAGSSKSNLTLVVWNIR